jgi:hypothetical protein
MKSEDGCSRFGVTNIDGVPSVGDIGFYDNSQCVFPYKKDPTAMTQSATGQYELVAISAPLLPANAAWIYEDRFSTTSQLSFKLNLAGRILFNGERTDKGLQVLKATNFADGSLHENLTFTATSRELSDFGLSEVSIFGDISCTYATGVLANGDCRESTGTLTGAIYGVAVNAAMRQLPGAPEIHEIAYGDKKIIVTVNKVDLGDPSLNQFSVKTSGGEVFALTGEETSRLRFY